MLHPRASVPNCRTPGETLEVRSSKRSKRCHCKSQASPSLRRRRVCPDGFLSFDLLHDLPSPETGGDLRLPFGRSIERLGCGDLSTVFHPTLENPFKRTSFLWPHAERPSSIDRIPQLSKLQEKHQPAPPFSERKTNFAMSDSSTPAITSGNIASFLRTQTGPTETPRPALRKHRSAFQTPHLGRSDVGRWDWPR